MSRGTSRSRSLWLSILFVAVSWGALVPIQAQVFEIGGGKSSLYQAGGGNITIHAPTYEFNMGAGTVDGHLLGGARMIKKTERGTYIFGDDRIDFRLPTDIFDTSHYLLARGIGYSGVRHNLDIVAFVGAGSLEYNSPFFNGSKSNDPMGVVFLKRQLTSKLQFYSDSIVARKPTEIAALQWLPAAKTEIAVAAGIGASQPFAAASLNMARKRFDLQAAFIAAGDQFRRVTVGAPLLAEPDRENILITYRPLSFLTVSGSHQNYLVPEDSGESSIHSSINQLSSSLHLLGTQLTGTVFHSTYDQAPFASGVNNAAAFSATRDFTPRFHVAANYFLNKPEGIPATDSFLTTVSEVLTSRISVNESITSSNGNTSVRFGGEFVSNLFTFTANYDTFYVPVENSQPFQQALLLDAKFKLLGRLIIHGASFVDPTGHLRYTADARTVLSREQQQREAPPPMGRYVLHGCVVDGDGLPVEGAAVLIDERPIYTDSSGCFYMREMRQHTHRLRVVLSEFLIGGNWQITSMPTSITSTTEEKSSESTVVVTVRRVWEVSGNADKKSQPTGTGGDR